MIKDGIITANESTQLLDALDEVILVLSDSTTPEVPLYAEVDEGDVGERVEIYIG